MTHPPSGTPRDIIRSGSRRLLPCIATLLVCAVCAQALPFSESASLALQPEFLLFGDSTAIDPNRMLPLGDTQYMDPSHAPRTPWLAARWAQQAAWQPGDSLQLGLWFENRTSSQQDSNPYLALSGSLDWRPQPELLLHTTFSTMVNQQAPAEFPGNWGDVHAGSREAWLQWSRSWFQLRAGRMSLNTGPESGRSLLLSNSTSLDGWRLEVRPGKKADGLWLSAFHYELDTRAQGTHTYARWLTGHRVGWTWANRASLALAEAILYGKEHGGPSWAALNPLQPLHAVQMNGLEANTVFQLSGWWKLNERQLLSGEILVDDLQLDDASRDDQEPDEWAVQLDLRNALPADILLHTGYTRITQRSYNSKFGHQVWLIHERPLAHPLGADADEFRLGLSWKGSARVHPSWSMAVRRQGERTPWVPFDQPWLEPDARLPYSEPFPTGVVQRTVEHTLAVESLWRSWTLRLAWTLPQVRNLDHVPGQDRSDSFVELRIFGGIARLPGSR
ncbi:MAG: hypothetical protein KC518_04190 [Candidatus Cloacimonetes bacterium]|nr:hypothetical protein [Candidatus Cloacimonadota bacterium]